MYAWGVILLIELMILANIAFVIKHTLKTFRLYFIKYRAIYKKYRIERSAKSTTGLT